MDETQELPEAYFGNTDSANINWRKAEDVDPDDEQLTKTPDDVIQMLGFDPLSEYTEGM